MGNENGKIIYIKDLYFSYNGHPVLSGVNLDIYEKEIVSIVGPNGGGKTTLLRLILGLLKPKQGTILVDGRPPSAASRIIGYVPQRAHHDNDFPITVAETVLSGRIRPLGFYTKKDRLMAEKALAEVGLEGTGKESFNSLSGGQMQRILIARALVAEAKILMLDEPTSNIDHSAGENLNSLLRKLNQTMTIMLVTHDTGFVANITDRVLCINKKLVEHPADDNFCEMIASSYEDSPLIVRHEKLISRGDTVRDKQDGNK
ncbi:MAG TPA: ABC transporter ATP-binding protein [Spirochaetota bacterium]|nr:ABC transporter ATP-binding protein [Spirochaetota bacterium]HPJ34284.1 ABC transporter ATP-binding protein [Spirochaetota bacterium]